MKINGIVLDPRKIVENSPVRYLNGVPIGNNENSPVVIDIRFYKNFNSELDFAGPCYVVFLDGEPKSRIIIDKKMVTMIHVELEQKRQKDNEATVQLPE